MGARAMHTIVRRLPPPHPPPGGEGVGTKVNSMTTRIPPIQCLLTFETLARLRSVTQAAEELCVTPSAVSHRVKQLEQIIGTKLFGRVIAA